MADLTPLQEKIRKAAEIYPTITAHKKLLDPAPIVHDEDLVPEVDQPERSAEQLLIDEKIDGLTIIEAYRRWCGKMEPKVGSRAEGIKISCPIPGHVDSHPSAWINTEKETWFCGGCQIGGDKYDLAAWHFGFPVPSYKEKDLFPVLRLRMAEDLGLVVIRTPGQRATVLDPEASPDPDGPDAEVAPDHGSGGEADTGVAYQHPDDSVDSKSGSPQEPPLHLAPILSLVPDNEDDGPGDTSDATVGTQEIDWRSMIAPDTFLDEWMNATHPDFPPDNFFFFEGMMALGMATGRNVRMLHGGNVYPNLFVCLYANSSTGKSRSVSHLIEVVRQALPYDDSPTNIGSKVIQLPGSPEQLLMSFSKKDIISNPTTGAMGFKALPVRGLLTIDELSLAISRSKRNGGDFRPLLQMLFDSYDTQIVHETRTKEPIVVGEYFCSAITSTQTAAVQELLDTYDAISGFLNRWLFVRGMSLQSNDPFHQSKPNFSTSIASLENVHQWGNKISAPIESTPEAQKINLEWRYGTFIPRCNDIGAENDLPFFMRMDLHVAKFALILAINEQSRIVNADHMRRALSLVPYLESTYDVLSTNLSNTKFKEIKDWIIARLSSPSIQRSNGWVPSSVLMMKMPKRFDLETVLKVVTVLSNLRVIEVHDAAHAKTKRVTRYYRVKP